MSLIDCKYLQLRLPDTKIQQGDAAITVRGIGSWTHQCSEYVCVNFFITGRLNGKKAIVSITHQLHIVDELKAKVLVGMDILGLEQAIIDINRQRLTLPMCENFTTDIKVTPKRRQTNKVVLASKLTTIPTNSVTAVPIHLRGTVSLLADQDFVFQPVSRGLNLGLQGGPRGHIVDTGFVFVEVQNRTNRPVVIPRKARLGNVLDYKEEGCYAIDAKEAHLAAGAKWPKPLSVSPSSTFDTTNMTEKHATGFTAYGNQATQSRLFAAAAAHKIWAKTGRFINVPESKWMPIPLKPGAQPAGAKVYQLGPEDRKLIDETFDLLHEQGKIE